MLFKLYKYMSSFIKTFFCRLLPLPKKVHCNKMRISLGFTIAWYSYKNGSHGKKKSILLFTFKIVDRHYISHLFTCSLFCGYYIYILHWATKPKHTHVQDVLTSCTQICRVYSLRIYTCTRTIKIYDSTLLKSEKSF